MSTSLQSNLGPLGISQADYPAFRLLDLGIADYEPVYEKQKELVSLIKNGTSRLDSLIFVEHPAVYTYGRKNIPEFSLENSFFIERGGESTFHNIGQLVAYPILQLREHERDLHIHLRRLESVLIDVLADFGIQSERRSGATGVWVRRKQKKIASIGVACSGWVTYHGCALNVRNDLIGFQKINPCGFSAEVMTSMKEELGERCPGMEQVKAVFLEHFQVHFERQLVL